MSVTDSVLTEPAMAADGPHLTIVRSHGALAPLLKTWRAAGERIGLVPTMGALHAGHLALIAAARRDCTRVVATIFVNPKQFDEPDDLGSYPRREAEDIAKLAAAGTDLLYAPPVEDIYPAGFATQVSVPSLSDCLCGAARPGHMTGVATVVAKLLVRVLPDRAYLGEKDFQQLLLVRRMAGDLDLPAEIIGIPTVRDADGLALSSRNTNLSEAERRLAPTLPATLRALAETLADGRAAEPVLATARARLREAGFAKLDYLELRREEDLEPLTHAEPPARLFVAAWLGETRLIDNLPVPTAAAGRSQRTT